MKRRPRNNSYNDDRYSRYDDDYEPNRGKPPVNKSPSWFNATAIGIIAAIFVLGIGVGIAFSAATPTNSTSLVTNLQLDQKAPNPDICIQNGASAMAVSTRLYVTLVPFKVFVAQAAMEPACILRRANWSILEQRKLLSGEQTRDCRNRMNTFGYVGDLNNKDKLSIDCVYQSDSAKNLFLDGASIPTLGSDEQF
ncbi:DUF3172 domain-containing protein [Leptolyngbya sp. NIES-2104]|uniref:DUF3172 domain-containing protein n=1 Tax=Leptolyngbya sp. NIES-2104 TaxID=1552121 RepID=UPI0006EC4C37|nr:DUF3172 domain-containing protein [Leptolyngbya sp. NIES-2104]GAP93839.1 conserved hypothetical protein [Leptolyngbya sp. NIES-2104]